MEHHMRLPRFSLLLLTIAAVGLAQAQPAYNLKYNYTKGKTYRYGDTVVSAMTQEMMGQEMKVDSRLSAVTRLVVEGIEKDGLSSLVMSQDAMTLWTKSPRGDTTIVMTDALNKRSRVKVTALGEVKGREIIDTLKAGGMMRGGASTRELFRVVVFSAKPVKAGENWTANRVDTVDANGGSMVTETAIEYTLVGTEKVMGRSCVKLAYTGKMTLAGKSKMMGMDIFTEGSGTLSGTSYFDEKAGIILLDEGKQNMEMTAAVTGQQNMTIPITQSSTSKHVLLPE
jgi:hypothetical protein